MYVSGIIPKEQKKEPELCVNNNNKTKASKTGLFLYETVMSYRQNTAVFLYNQIRARRTQVF